MARSFQNGGCELKLGGREFFAVLLGALLLNPSGLIAASTGTTRAALGSIESRGAVRVGEILAPSQSTLFAGDRVATNSGQAVIQYRQGTRVVLAGESVANFAQARVQLEKGLMTFQTASNSGMVFAAATLRMQPAAAKTAANVTFTDSKASISVTEGTLKVLDPSGVQLASLKAGEARLFEEAPASPAPSASASAAPPAAPPQGTASPSSSRKWLIGVGAAVVGAYLGVAGLVRADDANSRADSQASLVARVEQQNAALSAQITALRSQAAALSAFLNTVSATSAQQQALINQLSSAVADISAIQTQLSAVQAQTTQILSAIAAQGGVATPAQLATLQSLAKQGDEFRIRLAEDTKKVDDAAKGLADLQLPPPPPPISPSRASGAY